MGEPQRLVLSPLVIFMESNLGGDSSEIPNNSYIVPFSKGAADVDGIFVSLMVTISSKDNPLIIPLGNLFRSKSTGHSIYEVTQVVAA